MATENLQRPHTEPSKNKVRKNVQPIRVLFLNTLQYSYQDSNAIVHFTLIRSFDRTDTIPYMIANSSSVDVEQTQEECRSIPDFEYRFKALGMPLKSQHGLKAKLSFAVSVIRSLAQSGVFIHQKRIDIIHASDRPRDAVFSTLLGRITRRPNVIHMHANCGPHLAKTTVWALKNSTAIFAISEYIRQSLIEMGIPAQKIHVIHNSTDTSKFDAEKFRAESMAMREEYKIPSDALLIGCVGRLIPWKGQRELIEAMVALQSRYPTLRLMLVGRGASKQELIDLSISFGVQEKVTFTGWHDDIRGLVAAFDVFALPSYEEPFGLAITEAMAMALPVIACRSGGVPEIIQDGQNGLLIAPQSSTELAEALDHLLASADLRQQLGREARKHIETQFHPVHTARLASEKYRLILGRP